VVSKPFQVGSLRAHRGKWESIVANKTVQQWISDGVELPVDSDIIQPFDLSNRHLSQKHRDFLQEEIRDLVNAVQ
jgi:hypothetical protein